MTNDAPITLDPEHLAQFVSELVAAGFTRTGESDRSFVGPLPASLADFTNATAMTIVIADAWPYRQPSVVVEGIEWWHAAHEMPCLWQAEDNTKRWVTLQGVLARIDEWAENAKSGFTTIDGAALDPQLYFESYLSYPAAIDLEDLVGGMGQDGQHDTIYLDFLGDDLAIIKPGKGQNALWGRWFYRSEVGSPPTNLNSFFSSLTEKQQGWLERVLRRNGKGLFALIWPTAHGIACLVLVIDQASGDRKAFAIRPTPISQSDRLRRAGPDADVLLTKRVVLFGVGAIGSHLGSIMSRSGLGELVVIDG
ncbi:hypothetical protein JYT71_01580, partial [Acidimicrobiaceae bacterium AH-315-P05]|nr:hypothetical protein [Acidimicrobiaceae bacterium AH-315-P05]